MSRTKVTVAIPTYNRAHLLKDALGSCLAQDYPDFQVMVLDNSSSDDTEAVVRSYSDERVTYLRNETNIGSTRNLNRAIEVNESPYLSLLLDDDVLLPGFLRESVTMLDENPNIAFSFVAPRYVDINRVPLGIQHTQDMPTGVMEGWKYVELHVNGGQCYIEPSTVMMRAAALAEVGGFDSPHGTDSDDLNLWFRLAARSPLAFSSQELVEVRIHQGQLSESRFRQGAYGHYGFLAEQIDGIAYLLRSAQANEQSYRERLVQRLLSLHYNQSLRVQAMVPEIYFTWTERLEMAKHDLSCCIPKGSTFVLVDDSQWGPDVVSGSRSIPFLERNGDYWGPPPDDDTAIRELERLRGSGASFIVFGWPAFWWLDFYDGLHDYLRSRFRCILKNSRLIAFDLKI